MHDAAATLLAAFGYSEAFERSSAPSTRSKHDSLDGEMRLPSNY